MPLGNQIPFSQTPQEEAPTMTRVLESLPSPDPVSIDSVAPLNVYYVSLLNVCPQLVLTVYPS